MAVLVIAASVLAGRSWTPTEAGAAAIRGPGADEAEVTALTGQLEAARGELRIATAHLERWNRIFEYAREYKIASDLSAAIYDAAINERIDPELAFPLVRLESQFNERATSPVGATGLTQLMLATARDYDQTITRESLYDRETNLRIGFRYLRRMIKWQRGDIQMALLAYNRGPAAVIAAKELDLDASNGYDRVVLKGYRGRGVLD
ncbi:MAG: transglycosylase SLT domain-containing protein [Gemmatimonadaceae bacterium]